jgi:RimJ/RimL family protein N-acetyltransferase
MITTERLTLVPLDPADAEEMFAVLDDERLHEFTGGRPDTLTELRYRYARLTAGSGKPDEQWLNWVVRRRSDSQPIGTVQATVSVREGGLAAHVAWVVGVTWQRHGFASEAARALVDWLWHNGAHEVLANIHPDHRASAAVAAQAGLRPTHEFVDGERVWRGSSP